MNSSTDPPDTSALPESLRLLSLLWSLTAALDRTSRAMDAIVGVTGPQRFLLRFIGLEPGITCDQLAAFVALEAADLRNSLEQLVAKGLLITQSEPSRYYLTGSGAAINASMNGTVEEAVSKAIDQALLSERTAFRRMLERILQHLGGQ